MFISPLKNNNNTIKETQHGRTLTEMLGVIAIIGVLTIGSIAGYNFAMMKYRANETQNTLNVWAVTCMQQLALSDTLDTSELGSVTSLGYAIAAAYPIDGQDNAFQITLGGGGGVPVSVCKRLLEMYWKVPAEIKVGDQIFQGDSDICGEGEVAPVMVYTFDAQSDSEGGTDYPDEKECSDGQFCGSSCCAQNATCIEKSCCLTALVCDGVCCPLDKPVCEEGVCIDPEDKPCETNADCAKEGAGYFCQIGAKPECGNGTVIGRCKKASVSTFYGGGVRYAQSISGSYTRFDLENFCQALGMSPLTQSQADCGTNPECYAMGLYDHDSGYVGWDAFWIIGQSETTCNGDIVFFSTKQTKLQTLGSNDTKNRLAYLVCAKGTSTGICDEGYVYDTSTKNCVCNDDYACFFQTPNLPYCVDKECAECRMSEQCIDKVQTPYCSETLHKCVACRTHQDCVFKPETPYCSEEGICVKCSSDEDCKDVSGKPYCNGAGKCVACYKNDHCSSNAFCRVKENIENCRLDESDGTCETLNYNVYTDASGGKWYRSTGGGYNWFDTQNYCNALKRKLGGSIRTMTRADLGCPTSIPPQSCPAQVLKNFGWWGDYFLESINSCSGYEWYAASTILRPVTKIYANDYGTSSFASCYQP